MQYLFASWPSLAGGIKAAPHLLLLSDYDGTLTPIVSRPEDAVLPLGVKEKLAALAGNKSVTVGVISGRSMTDIRAMVGIEGIYYAGYAFLSAPCFGLWGENARSTAAAVKRFVVEGLPAFLDRCWPDGVPGP